MMISNKTFIQHAFYCTILCAIGFFPANGQRRTDYKVWVQLSNGDRINGKLFKLEPSSITLSKNNELETEKITIDASDIQFIKIRGRNAVWKGTLIGAGVGGAMGAIVGLITYEPCNECFLDFGPGYNIGGGFVLGTLSGTLVGTFIGISKKKYVINGNLEEFNKVKIKINGY